MTLVLQKEDLSIPQADWTKRIRTYDLLDGLGVEYDRVDHAPAMTMEDCKEVDEILESMVCKNLFLCNRQETAFYLLMIPIPRCSIPRICRRRSVRRDYLLPSRNIWRNFWISPRICQCTRSDER